MDSGLAALRRSGMTAALILAIACSFAAAQQSNRPPELASEYPLTNDDGSALPNHTVKLIGPIDRLPGVVVAANPKGKTTLYEFYDLNCPYCRAAAADIAAMVERDQDLRLVLVPFPILGIPSIMASRVELAVAKLGTPKQFYDFHRKIYAQRGVIDGARALAVAHGLGLDEKALTKAGDGDDISEIMKNHVKLGDALGLAATPSFVVDGVALLGYPGRDRLQAIVDAAGTCGKVVC
jgi:protein-disulfide isomerase